MNDGLGGSSPPQGVVSGGPVATVAPTLESLSRDIGVAAGGTALTLRGWGFTGTSGVTFGGAAATSVVVVNDNKLTCVTPSGSASETAVDVVVTNAKGSSPPLSFEYGAVTATTYASVDFESGSYGVLTATGGAATTIGALPWARGSSTKCVSCTATSGGGESSVSIGLANNPLLATNGLWLRAFYAIPSATMTLVETTGQIKTVLCRVNNTTPETVMTGIGTQFGGAGSQICSRIDNGLVPSVGSSPGSHMGDNIWLEDAVQITRNSGASTGRIRRWINGKLVWNVTSANIGANTTTDTYAPRWGAVFTQATPAGTLHVYIDAVQASDGYLEPLTT